MEAEKISMAVSEVDYYKKVLSAANWKSESEQPEFGDPNYRAFVQVMEYRRDIANRYLNEQNTENKRLIMEILEQCNSNIREILGL